MVMLLFHVVNDGLFVELLLMEVDAVQVEVDDVLVPGAFSRNCCYGGKSIRVMLWVRFPETAGMGKIT